MSDTTPRETATELARDEQTTPVRAPLPPIPCPGGIACQCHDDTGTDQ